MKADDIVTQLQKILPIQTDLFSDTLTTTSVTNVGNIVTVVTSSAHGLATGVAVVIAGTAQLFQLASLIQTSGIATGVTVQDNDLTFGDPASPSAVISGADQSGYNGTKTLLNVLNRRTFQFQVDTATVTPATGTIFLEDSFRSDFNGRFAIVVVNTTTFTYDLGLATPPLDSTLSGTPIVRTGARISKLINIDRGVDSYTKQLDKKLWGFVVLGDQTISRDRRILSDASQTINKMDHIRIREIQPVSVYIFIPTENEISGADAKDLAVSEVKKAIYSSIFLFKPPSELSDTVWSKLTPVSNGTFVYSLAYYVHEFVFEQEIDLVLADGVIEDDDRAFRDLDFNVNNTFGVDIYNADVNLDEQPL